MFFADEEDRDSNDLSQVIGRWSKSKDGFAQESEEGSMVTSINSLSIGRGARRRDTGKKGVLPVRMQTIGWWKKSVLFCNEEIVSFRILPRHAEEKLSNDPLHPSAFIHWNIQHWFHGSDRTRWIESKNVVW